MSDAIRSHKHFGSPGGLRANRGGMVDDAGNKRPAWFAFHELAQNAPQPPTGNVEITNVTLTPTTLDTGQVLECQHHRSQWHERTARHTSARAEFVYNEGETFLSRGFAEVNGAYRVGIDFAGRTRALTIPIVGAWAARPCAKRNAHHYGTDSFEQSRRPKITGRAWCRNKSNGL